MEEDLKHLLSIIKSWCRKWQLELNLSKIDIMHGRKERKLQSKFVFFFDKQPVPFCANYIYCQTSVLSLKTWSWLWFTPVTRTTTRTTRRTPTKYLSCYWPDFDQTLIVGTWEPLEQIPTVTVTFVHATFVLATYVLATIFINANIFSDTNSFLKEIWT